MGKAHCEHLIYASTKIHSVLESLAASNEDLRCRLSWAHNALASIAGLGLPPNLEEKLDCTLAKFKNEAARRSRWETSLQAALRKMHWTKRRALASEIIFFCLSLEFEAARNLERLNRVCQEGVPCHG
jgi:hypothetical protein